MPRVTYVKAAQQRYKTVPVLDEQGNPTYRERVLKRPTKRGVTVTRQRVTVADKNQPLAPLTCDACGQAIEVGQAYKWIKPKSGPYGGRQRQRHAHHPNWHPWEYSTSLSARIQEIQHNAHEAINDHGFETQEDVESILSDVADAVRELAEEKREGASNIEDGFGHPTSQSEELEQIADDLDSWADDIEGADIPEDPDPEDAEPVECTQCDGEGTTRESCADCLAEGVIYNVEGEEIGDCQTCDGGMTESQCPACEGGGTTKPTEVTEEQMDEWRDQVEQALSIVDESPV